MALGGEPAVSRNLREELSSMRGVSSLAFFATPALATRPSEMSREGSDLDSETRKQLDRWARMIELLKQWVFAPVSVPKQTCSIYAWSKGYLDNIAVSKVGKFEQDLYNALEDEKTVLAAIESDKQIKEETETKLVEVIKKVVEINK